MWSPYRLAYLVVIGFLMGGVAFVTAQEASHSGKSGFALGLESLNDAKEALTARPVFPVDGAESGNLSNVGAKEILTDGEFLAALVASKKEPVLLFKHSTSCNVSGGAYRRVAEWMDAKGDEAPATFLVKVIEHKPVSEKIAEQTRVKHESPQAILLRDGKAVWMASHKDITAEALDGALKSVASHRNTD